MKFRTIRVVLLLSVLPVAGCGTVSNVVSARPEAGGKVPFGGVKKDLRCIHQASNEEWGARPQPQSESDSYLRTSLMLLCAADLPFSLVGDIVTWPYTASYSFINEPIPTPQVVLVGGPTANPLPPAPVVPVVPPMKVPVPPALQSTPKGPPTVPVLEIPTKPTTLP